MENNDAISISSANSGKKLVLKIIFEENKFKQAIKDESTTFKLLKEQLLEKINKSQDPPLQPQDIKILDNDDFDLDDSDLVFDLLNQNDTIKVAKKQQEPVKQEQSIQIQEEQKQQQQQQDLDAQKQQEKDQQTQNQEEDTPDEAIVVLYDVSGSMGCRFYGDQHLSRMGATNAFFSAFADKIMAFECQNLLSLICFDSAIDQKCQFITDYQKFINLVDSANPGSATRLYDSIQLAINQLLEIKQKYPDIILRILALTDGEDNKSTAQPINLAQQIYNEGIIVDSFVVSDICKGLKNITHASGGKCYRPKDINEGLQLFEIETIISAKSRGLDFEEMKKQKNQKVDWEKIQTMDFDSEGISVQKATGADKGVIEDPAVLLKRVEEIYKKQEALQQQKMKSGGAVAAVKGKSSKQSVSSGGCQKRILKEYQDILNNPELYIKYFPVADDITVWKVFMIGPPNTVYNQGIYQLSLIFPQDYPFKPPKVTFVTPVYHCNVSSQGSICLDILKDQWSPALTISKVFNSLHTLLQDPNPDDALNSNIASEMRDKTTYHIYEQKALDQTLANANPTIEQLLIKVLGQDFNKTSQAYADKKEEFTKWINSCRVNNNIQKK